VNFEGDALTSVVLIRHGESYANAARLIGGPRSCGGLSPTGRAQVEALARRLQVTGELDGCVLLASGFRRAIETATIVGQAIGLGDPIVDERFGELDPGEECDGMSFDEFVERFGAPDWPGDPQVSVFPGGETIAGLRQRVADALEDVTERYPGRVIAIGTHGGVVDAAIRHATSAPVVGEFDLWTTNASLTGITRMPAGRWRIDRYNDAAHLLEAR
jgi:probable phosphoglycerate mutase